MHPLRKRGARIRTLVPEHVELREPSICHAPRSCRSTQTCSGSGRRNRLIAAMLILAIDTALEACAAAVLDTDAGELLAQERSS